MALSPRFSPRPAFLSALINTAYFPRELPPAITSRNFSIFCKNEYSYLAGTLDSLTKLSTQYETVTAPRATYGRRHLALVHPLAQLGLSILLTQNRATIKKLIGRRDGSLYSTAEDLQNYRAFAGLQFRERDSVRPKLYSECPIVLKADISRFFYTVYTHSIPWAVLGKEKVKEWRVKKTSKLNGHWSNKLDKAVQSCQSRETFGIPVGPDTSRILAEILLAGVESDKQLAKIVDSKSRFRLLDDYEIGFDNESAATDALIALRSALWEFNLQLNEEKTGIHLSQTLIGDLWKHELNSINVSHTNPRRQENEIYHLVDLTLQYCAEAETGAPASWATRRLGRTQIIMDNFSVHLNAMFRLARDYPSCLSHVVVFLINNKIVCNHPKFRDKIVVWLKGCIKVHHRHQHDIEISWLLLVAGVFQITLDEPELPPFGTMPNSIVFAILGMLSERGLLSVPLSKWKWRAAIKKEGVLGKYWLPFYEAVRRGWTTDQQIIVAVKSQPILSKMLDAQVTFLEDRVFDMTTINVVRRKFKSDTKFNTPRKSKGQQSYFFDISDYE